MGMELQQPEWSNRMRDKPFTQSRFTDELRARTMDRAHRSRRKRRFQAHWAAAILGIVLVASVALQASRPSDSLPGGASTPTRTSSAGSGYYAMGNHPLKVYADDLPPIVYPGNVEDYVIVADRPFGYRYHLTVPIADVRNRLFSAYATHVDSGQRVTAVATTRIPDQGQALEGKDTYAVSFALPLGGEWRVEAFLDSREYGVVTVEAEEPTWELSRIFDLAGLELIGDEGKVGFTDSALTAGVASAYTWYFWGDDAELEGEFILRAVRIGDSRMMDLYSVDSLDGPLDGADRHVVTSYALPEKGLWRLIPFIDGRQMNSLVVEVKGRE